MHAALRELIVGQTMHAHQSMHMRILRRQSNEKLFLVERNSISERASFDFAKCKDIIQEIKKFYDK